MDPRKRRMEKKVPTFPLRFTRKKIDEITTKLNQLKPKLGAEDQLERTLCFNKLRVGQDLAQASQRNGEKKFDSRVEKLLLNTIFSFQTKPILWFDSLFE